MAVRASWLFFSGVSPQLPLMSASIRNTLTFLQIILTRKINLSIFPPCHWVFFFFNPVLRSGLTFSQDQRRFTLLMISYPSLSPHLPPTLLFLSPGSKSLGKGFFNVSLCYWILTPIQWMISQVRVYFRLKQDFILISDEDEGDDGTGSCATRFLLMGILVLDVVVVTESGWISGELNARRWLLMNLWIRCHFNYRMSDDAAKQESESQEKDLNFQAEKWFWGKVCTCIACETCSNFFLSPLLFICF